jgi:hypothetical protein
MSPLKITIPVCARPSTTDRSMTDDTFAVIDSSNFRAGQSIVSTHLCRPGGCINVLVTVNVEFFDHLNT